MTGASIVFHLFKGPSRIGADIFVTPPFWSCKQDIQLSVSQPGDTLLCYPEGCNIKSGKGSPGVVLSYLLLIFLISRVAELPK